MPQDQLLPDVGEAFGQHSKSHSLKRAGFYDEYLTYGGFPEVVSTPDHATKKMILKNIFASFFEKDIKVFSELKDVRELRDLILLLAPRNGNIIDITRLSSELGVNRVKIYNYLEFLEGTFFLRLVPKFSKSIDRSVAGGKKVYFSDTGILNLVTTVTPGQLLETAVANQLQHYGDISFYNKQNTSEIDFILDGEIALEVKQKAINQDVIKLEKLSGKLGLRKYYIVGKTSSELNNIIHPWFF